MTEIELDKLLGVWTFRLGLSDWNIRMKIEPCEDNGSYMETTRSVDYDRAVIVVQPWLLGKGTRETDETMFGPGDIDDNFIEASLVHELLHLVTRDLCVIVRDDLYGHVSTATHDLLVKTQKHAEERVVDRLAAALVRAFNLLEPA